MSKQTATSRSRRGIPTKGLATGQKPEPAGSRTWPGRFWAAQTPVRVVGVLIVGLVIGILLPSGLQKVIAEPPEEVQRWQYSRFTFAPTGVSWSTPDRHYVAQEPDELYRYIAESDSQGQITTVEIANLIGSLRWELVSVTYSNDPRGYDNYWFKRAID